MLGESPLNFQRRSRNPGLVPGKFSPSGLFYFPSAFFGFQSLFFRSPGRPGLRARLGFLERLFHQLFESLNGGFPVLVLGPVLMRFDDQFSRGGHAPACQVHEARLDLLRQVGVKHVKTKLRRAGNLVDILPARARGAHVYKGQLAFVDA